jgi:hypothetical protein
VAILRNGPLTLRRCHREAVELLEGGMNKA